jgi:4-amino-4-deoxy-L-arabinose transferase-like glycosyltransferase
VNGTDTASKQRTRILLAAILLVAAGLRFGFLSSRGWWFDEALTVVETRLDLPEMLRRVSRSEHMPPLYFVLANRWATVAGTSEVGLRSFSAALGVGAVWLAYVVAARLVSTRAGLVAAALAAVNPMLVWFSLEARPYSLLTVLGGWSFVSFVEARERPRVGALVAWTITAALALWTHYFAVFLVGPEALWLLLRHPRSRAVHASLLGLALAAAALFPFLVPKLGRVDWIGEHTWLMRVASVLPEILLGFQPPAPLVLAPLALLTPTVSLWLLCARADPDERRGATTAALVAAAALAVPMLITLLSNLDVMVTRYLAAATIPILVVIAAGLGTRRGGRLAVTAVALTCALGAAIDLGTASVSKFEHEDWRGAARAMGPADGVRALVLTPSRGALPLGLYRSGLRELAGPPAAVSEIVVVALPPMFRRLGQPSVPPRPPSPLLAVPFQTVERVDADSFTRVRYRAATPVTLDRARLAALRLGPEDAAVLLESPGE